MKQNKKLSEVWLKASVLGATWAASEIILGSFLHNLHVPFKGNILTAIGLILMIAVSFKWKDKGLFWRSGLICALMKTMSPSAVIFGPMIAIFMEAVLFEFSVRLLGRSLIGFIVGSSLAMAWVLVQKVFNLIIFYGFDIVEIYEGLLKFVQKQLHLHTGIFWIPLLFLLGLYIIFGIVSALIGHKIGKDLLNKKRDILPEANISQPQLVNNLSEHFKYSLFWLGLNFFGMIGALILISTVTMEIWLPASVLLILIWVLRYKRAMRQLRRPKFYISFVFITVLAALVISYLGGGEANWREGLMVGLEMNTRAAIVIVGFTVLGTELYNPVIRNFLKNTAYKDAGMALELAFETLPIVVSKLPNARAFLSNPMEVIKILISHAEERFNELKTDKKNMVFVVAGSVAEGKTTYIEQLSEIILKKGVNSGGFYCPRILENDQTIGYDLVSVESRERFKFLTLKKSKEEEGIGKFAINLQTRVYWEKLLEKQHYDGNKVIFIDEIGKLELIGQGWRNSLARLLEQPELCIVAAVRRDFIDEVIGALQLNRHKVLDITEMNVDDAANMILEFVPSSSALA